jgi:shikimate kinase
MKDTKRYTLIGMSGVGKTTVSKLLAENLACDYIESDPYIEEVAELEGIDPESLTDVQFIELADRAIVKLVIPDAVVIDTGGSLIYAKEAMQRLQEATTIVYLEDSIENIKRKFEKRGVPLRLVGSPGKTFDELCLERFALYKKCADLTLDVSVYTEPSDLCKAIIAT